MQNNKIVETIGNTENPKPPDINTGVVCDEAMVACSGNFDVESDDMVEETHLDQ